MQGTEFFIAVPPNELNPYPTNGLEVYVCSQFDTEITVTDFGGGKTFKKEIAAYVICTLSDNREETNWTWEIREPEQNVKKGVRITSEKPICVYVLNSKTNTSDGYLAIPVSGWGASYVHVGYYDFKEFKPWAGGFVVVASEDGTSVQMALRGAGGSDAVTAGGKRIGETISVTLDAGDVYMVKGDGQTRGTFDLTGSAITSSKPIGLISFHERTTMPNMLIHGNGRNHLVEMLPPVNTWGKRYITKEFSRGNVNGMGRGDMFRVVAKEPGTRWTLMYYDLTSKALVGSSGGIIETAGGFVDLFQSGEPRTLPYGFSVWEADKPIHVMQYSCSSSFDGDSILDPFMVNVTPEEQFIVSTIFQTPTNAKFGRHRFNLIVKTDTASPDYVKNLESLEIDGIPVWSHPSAVSPKLKFSLMPGGFHWATIDFESDALAHKVTSNGNLSFSGYIYGFGAFDAYGWPLGGLLAELGTLDTMPPILVKGTKTPGRFNYAATEARNFPAIVSANPQATDQVERGIARVDTVVGKGSYNIKILGPSAAELRRPLRTTQTEFSVNVSNPRLDARAVFYVQDWADNRTVDSISCLAGLPIDSLRPEVAAVSYAKGVYTRQVSELRTDANVPTDCLGTKFQEESGLKAISFITENVQNMRYALLTQTTFKREPRTTEARFTWTVIDSTKNAHSYYNVADWAGNTVSDTVQYTAVTDVESEPVELAQLSLHPNPAQSACTVSWASVFRATRLEILDLIGNAVFTSRLDNLTRVSVDVSALPTGIYVVRITSSNSHSAQALLVK